MKNAFWDKRIPTLLSILLIGISIVITSVLVKNRVIFVTRADITQTPQDVKITNISDNSFTISYTTESENIASVSFGTDNSLGQTALDDRDQKGGIRPHKIHNFILQNLKPKTKYFFTIVSGDYTFLNNDVPYEITTAPIPQITPTPKAPITGKIVLPDGESPKEALVYANIDKAQEISSLAKTDGTYLLPLSFLLEDLSSPITLDANAVIKMVITNGSLKSNVLLSARQTNPVPVITLSNDYDFTQKTELTSSKSSGLLGFSSIISKPASPSATPSLAPTPTSLPTPTVIVPTATPIPSPTPVLILPTISPETPLGNSSIIIIGILSLYIIALGCLLLIKTRGGTSS